MSDIVAFLKARLDDDQRELDQMTSGGLVQGYLRVHGDKLKADVEAKRRLVDLHLPEPLSEWARKTYDFPTKCAGESWECYGDGEDIVQWPCDHLKLLALPYAEHPDYQEAWKP